MIGAGGLGSRPWRFTLASAGRGSHHAWWTTTWSIATNLQRQIAHNRVTRGHGQNPIGQIGHARPSTQKCDGSLTLICPGRCSAALDVPWYSPKPMWCWTVVTTSTTRQAVNAACVKHKQAAGVWALLFGLTGKSAVYDPRDMPRRLVTRAFSRPTRRLKKPAAPRWACSHRWSASSARCRRPRS